MSTPTLDEDAIAALFASAQDGEVPEAARSAPEARANQPVVRTVDFRRPRQFTGDVQRRLRRSLDTFCRTASSRLSSELRTAVDLEVIGVEQLTWSDAHGQLPTTSLAAVVTAEPINTRMLLAAELGLLLTGIERMLGGMGDQTPPQRRLTDIDMMLASELFGVLVDQLSVIWSELVEATLSIATVMSHQQSAQLAPTSEPTLSFTIEAKLLRTSTTLVLLIPFRSIAPVIARLAAGDGLDGANDDAAHESMRTGIGTVEMEVRAEVGSMQLPVAQVLEIKAGDLLALNTSARAGVTLFVDDAPLGRGRPGRSGSRRAVQIVAADGGGA